MHTEFPLVSEVYFAICKSIDTPVSLGAWLRYKHNQLALAQFDLPVRQYPDALFEFLGRPNTFAKDLLVSSFLSKYKGLDTKLDLEAVAAQKFTSSEDSCLHTNRRLAELRSGSAIPDGMPETVHADLFSARRKISDLLGVYDVSKVQSGCGWGPGSTTDIRRRESFVDTKMCKLPIPVTRKAREVIRKLIEDDLHWSSALLRVKVEDLLGPFCLLPQCFEVRESCVVEYVPKNAKTHRTIAKEPRANGFLQKGFGAYFRRRLKRVGVDLDDQGRNQDGAYRAYHDRLATLDLKAASDSVSLELVYELLPLDWAIALDQCRSPRAELPDGRTITLQKFSSMGNGFTFELESLIFWALTSSVVDRLGGGEVLIYGDDIILPQKAAMDAVQLLSACGFQTNDEKSFVSGAFFESCGRHYFHGTEVTPIYQKECVDDPQELIRLGNRLMRLAADVRHRCEGEVGPNGLYPLLFPAWSCVWRRAGDTRSFQLPLGTNGDDGWVLPSTYFSTWGKAKFGRTVRTVRQDINFGLECKVIRSTIDSLPGEEWSLLAHCLRRGVVNDNPFYGNVEVERPFKRGDRLKSGHRWVMPTGEFGLGW